MAGGVIPGLDFAGRRRFHLSGKASSDSPLSMATSGLTRQPSPSSPSPLRRNKPKAKNEKRKEKQGRKAKKAKESLDAKARPRSKSQTRREISCRTTATRDLYQASSPSSLQRNNPNQTNEDERLGVEAKIAKERLDERLRPHLNSQTKREISLRKDQVIQWKKTIFGCGRFNWTERKWKTCEQENCSVCLEELRNGESLVRLSCGHKFHSQCSRRWLQTNPHCPNCRNKTIP